MQLERLREARATGSKKLVTACPKCQIHLTCAMQNTRLDLQVIDLYTFLAERLQQ
jgi:Fe-S oxidoreductase